MYSTVLVEVGSRKEIIYEWLTPSRFIFFSCRYSHVDALIVEMKTKKYMLERFVKENFKNISLYYTGIILDSTEENQDYLHRLLVSDLITRMKITGTVVIAGVILFTVWYSFILGVAICQGIN